MKKLYIILLLLFVSVVSAASMPTLPVEVVQAYADNLSAWCETKDVSRYSDAIKDLCSDGFRVNDEIVCDWAKQKKMQELKHYDYNDYEKCLDELITKGVRIKISNIAIDNSVEFNIVNYGHIEPLAFVSGDLTVEGAANYHIKEIFKVRGGKITVIRNYESDLTLSRAFLMCKQGKYREAYDIFENIMYNSQNYGENQVAEKFAISILLKKGGQLKMDNYVRKYKLARNIYRENFGIERAPDYPMLDDKTYSFYAEHYENASDYRQRVAVLPTNWQKATPYTSTYDGIGWYTNKYYKNIGTRYRQIEKTRFPKVTKKLYGYVDATGKDVIPAQFKFAYTFDEKVGLALVQHTNGKWGYIDMQGKPRTPQNYDVASDVFVDGKSNVIRDGHLILIDTEGNELKSIYGYTDLSHKLREDEMLAISVESRRYDLIDFNGNIVKTNIENKRYGITEAYDDIGGCSFSYTKR